jgi:DNA end-binding protein Ku
LEYPVAASRPLWKGFLKLSFVSCPIALYPATTAAERIAFRLVNRRTGHRLRHQLVDTVTGEKVESADKGRGYEIGEDSFLLVDNQEIEQARQQPPQSRAEAVAETMQRADRAPPLVPSAALDEDDEVEPEPDRTAPPVKPQNTHTIDIANFLPVGQVDARYHEKPYYVVPREPVGQEAFAVIREAMRARKVAGLGRVMLASRERPVLLEPMGKGLRAVTLRFAYEVRHEADYFDELPDMKLPAEMLKLAEHIIDGKLAEFDPSMLQDHYRDALVRILRKKQAKVSPAPARPVTPSPQNVVNLMDALRRSLEAERPIPKPTPRRSAPGPRSSSAKQSNHRALRSR